MKDGASALRGAGPGPALALQEVLWEIDMLTVCVNCSFEKEFDGVQDVFELQVRSTCLGHRPGDDGGPPPHAISTVIRLLYRPYVHPIQWTHC